MIGPASVRSRPIGRVLDEVSDGVVVVPAPFGPSGLPDLSGAAELHRSRLPGIGARFSAGIATRAQAEGWSTIELLGLLAAVEERCCLWVVSGRSFRRRSIVRRWQPSGLVADGESNAALVSRVTDARSRRLVCVAGLAGGGGAGRALLAGLAEAGARVGNVDPASAPAGRWSIQLLTGPALAPDDFSSLRERVAAAPRCGWCRVPVLGTACSRCTAAGS